MGKNNRQRREDKHRRRDRSRAARSQAPAGPGGVRYIGDEVSTALLVRTAAVAMAQGDVALARSVLSDLTARPDAGRFAAAAVADLLAKLAGAGWEPRLLANLVRRRLSARHARVLTTPGESEGGALEGGALEGVEVTVEVLAVMMVLPPLPALPSASVVDEAQAKVLAKVRGLLAKAESTTFAEEAESLSAKAQELMARHAIDRALAVAAAAPEVPGGRRLPIEDPYADAKAMLVGSVSQANRCRSVHVVDLALVTLLGFEADLVAVELLFTSLLVQANRAMLAAGREDRRARQRGFRSSFLSAYAVRIGQRLEACTADQVSAADADEGGRLLPVLAARDDAVEDAVEKMFGGSLVHRPTRISDPRGWVAGHAAADLADLAVGPGLRATG